MPSANATSSIRLIRSSTLGSLAGARVHRLGTGCVHGCWNVDDVRGTRHSCHAGNDDTKRQAGDLEDFREALGKAKNRSAKVNRGHSLARATIAYGAIRAPCHDDAVGRSGVRERADAIRRTISCGRAAIIQRRRHHVPEFCHSPMRGRPTVPFIRSACLGRSPFLPPLRPTRAVRMAWKDAPR
jgi:hypothetical protein